MRPGSGGSDAPISRHPRCGHEQASHDGRAEISGRGHETAGQAAHGNQAQCQATGVGLDSDRRHPAANDQGHQRMTALVNPRGEELERIEEIRRPRREADDQRSNNRHPQPVSDRMPRRAGSTPGHTEITGNDSLFGSVASVCCPENEPQSTPSTQRILRVLPQRSLRSLRLNVIFMLRDGAPFMTTRWLIAD